MLQNTIKKTILVFLLGIICLPAHSKQSLIDSCLVALQSYSVDDFDKSHADVLHRTGEAFCKEEKYEQSLPYFLKSLSISKYNQNQNLIFQNYLSIGDAFFWQSEYDSSLLFLNEAIAFSKKFIQITSKDSLLLYSSLGNTLYYMGNIPKAYFYRTAALKLTQNNVDSLRMAETYYSIAELEKEQEKYTLALQKLNFALGIYLNRNRMEDASYCYDMMGNIYFKMSEYDKALHFMTKACDIEMSVRSIYHEGFCAQSLGEIHLKLDNYSTALSYLEKGLAIRTESGQKEEIIQSKMAIAELFMEKGNCKKAKRMLDDCSKSNAVIQIPPLRRDFFEKMFTVEYSCGNFKSAFEYQQKYFQIRDSISNDFTKKELASLSTFHEIEQQKQQLQLMQKEQQLSNMYYWIIFATCLVLVGFIGLMFWLYKKQYHYNSKLKKQKIKIEDQNSTLFNTNDKLIAANKELENFAYIASHDLKAPLRTISSYTGLLKRKYADFFDENGVEFLNLITDGVDHMSQLLEDVLAYSNVEKSEEILEPVDLNILFQKVLQTLHANIKEKNAIISVGKMPVVLGNPMQFFQVFQNLLSNAMKFIPEERRPEIEVTVDRKNGMHRFRIQDNGIGIEPQYQDRIFTIFKRLHTSQEFKGTGIGLSICKKIIEKMGGEIWVESDGENGTTFYFTLQPAEIKVEQKDVNVVLEKLDV